MNHSLRSILVVFTIALVFLVTGSLSTALAGDFTAFDKGQRVLGPGKTMFLPKACASDCPPPPFKPSHECLSDCKRLKLTFSGEGYSPQIGKYTWTGIPDVPCCPPANGCAEVKTKVEIVAEGGTIYMETKGENCRQDGWLGGFNGSYKITGGTGRFEKAKGKGSVIAILDYPSFKIMRQFKGKLKLKKK